MKIDFKNISRMDRLDVANYLAELDDVKYFDDNLSVIPNNFCSYVAEYGVNEFIASRCAMKVAGSLSNKKYYTGAVHSKHKAVATVYAIGLSKRSKCRYHIDFIKFSHNVNLVELFVEKMLPNTTHEECKNVLRFCRFNEFKVQFFDKIKNDLTLDEVNALIKHISNTSDKETNTLLLELKTSLTL